MSVQYDGSLFSALRDCTGPDWQTYVDHVFVRRIADGSLPEAAFRYYLIQDYLFLIHFSRAWALAAYKAETLNDIMAASEILNGISNTEMALHVEFCRGWGLTEADMEAAPEAPACLAYTRYVLETGLRGDLLDLHIALAPCVVGYGEIGHALGSAVVVPGNPYQPWIELYAGPEYQKVAQSAVTALDDLWARRGSEARRVSAQRIFSEATRLEIGFWQMGLDETRLETTR